MSDGVGGIVVSQSKDFGGDLHALERELNDIGGWDCEGGEFLVRQAPLGGTELCFGSVSVYDPTVFPTQDVEGSDDDCDAFAEPIPLEVLARRLTAHISTGELRIACSANESTRAVSMETLTLRADGSAERRQIWVNVENSFFGEDVVEAWK